MSAKKTRLCHSMLRNSVGYILEKVATLTYLDIFIKILSGDLMKKLINTSLTCIILGCSLLLIPHTSVSASEAASDTDDCAKELLLSYFPEPLVKETLKKFHVPEDKWAGITKSLTSHDKEIVKIVEQKASKMSPNPLKDSQQRQVAVKLFRDTLLETFSNTLIENGVTDKTQFLAMLDDIQQQKAKKFAMCMQKQKKNESIAAPQIQKTESNSATPSNVNIDSDNDDDDDDDDIDDDDDDDDDSDNNADHDASNANPS